MERKGKEHEKVIVKRGGKRNREAHGSKGRRDGKDRKGIIEGKEKEGEDGK